LQLTGVLAARASATVARICTGASNVIPSGFAGARLAMVRTKRASGAFLCADVGGRLDELCVHELVVVLTRGRQRTWGCALPDITDPA